MNGEVQLIVNNIGPANVASMSNDPILMGIGALSRFVVTSSPEVAALPLAQPITIYNAAGDSVTKTLNSIVLDSPVAGQTRLNLSGTWADDYSAAAGGYIIVQTGTQYYLDLFENESISQNWKFQDLSNFSAQGAFSREFRIPMSDNNIKAIGPLFDTNSEQGAENYFFYKLPAEIRVDTLPIATGYLRVRKVYKQMNRINEVEVAFYAETPDLVRTIGEKKLSDIAALADLNEAVTYDNVTTETADRIWALCDRGQLWSNSGGTGSRPILDASNPLYAGDLTPSISWWYLLRNIVTEAGFELVASSLENIIEDYYMPWCNTPQLTFAADTNDYLFQAYNSGNIDIVCDPTNASYYSPTVEVFDNNGDFTPGTGSYTAPVSGIYTFSGLFNVRASTFLGAANRGRISISIAKNTTFYPIVTTANFDSNSISQGFSYSIQLNAGDVVRFYVYAVAVAGTSSGGVVTGGCTVRIIAGDGSLNRSHIKLDNVVISSGQTIDYSLNAPDMRQIDFVNDVIKMHNCAIIPSRIVPNRIAIVPQNSYIGTGDVVDWTSKLDISKDVVIASTVDIQKATFQFTYTSGEDAYSKLYRDANRVYGDFKQEGYTINPSTAPSDFAIGEQKVTLVTRSAPAALIPGTNTPIQCFYNDQLEFVVPGPRALFNAGSIEVNLYDEGTGLATPVTEVPILNHYSNAYPTLTDTDLNWAPETPPHVVTVTANPYNNLFNSYWRNYMNELYSPEGRIMEAFFALDLKDILTFSFADKIWIQDSYWRILEISDYKVGLQESTKVKLIKFLDQINDCSSTPVGVTTNGEVEFESGGEPIEPTEDCCSRYGYFWDETSGICWAFNNGGQFRNSILPNTPAVNSAFTSVLNSFVNGTKVSIADGNSNMLAVGQDLNLTKFVDGSNLLGKNVETNLPGLHVGGGYSNGNATNAVLGWAQSGVVMLHYKDSWVNSQIYNLLIEGIANEFIELPDDTLWSCLMNATIIDTSTGDYRIGQYSFGLQVIGGIANATAITTVNEINNTAYTFTYDVDTTTNTDQHRVNLQVTGLGASSITFVVTASIHYQQNKLT
jgi:hypothetical protein